MKLFTPGRIGNLSIKNRIVMSPMAGYSYPEPDGRLSEKSIEYYAARAKGGVGLIITGSMYVSREIEYCPELPFLPRADGVMYIPRLCELAERVHEYGAKIAVQLTPGAGRLAAADIVKRIGAVGPSSLPCRNEPSINARELTVNEIERLIEAFQFSAEIVANAGIDAIEIHAHFGYLIDQFMTSLWNKRTDRYGGDFERRLRLPAEMIVALKKGAGSEFPVIFRFGLTHYMQGGRDVEEGLEICRRLEAVGVDALDINAGAEEVPYWISPPTTMPPGCTVDMAAMVKKVVDIPVITAGKLGYPDLAERVLQERKTDFISLGRALLADPDWPLKVKEKRPEDICPCIGDYEGCMGRIAKWKYASCTVNPRTGMENELAVRKAERKRSVLIVGGGPGGMEAARVAALRGHKVTLWEKSDVLGGNLIPASIPSFKQDYRALREYLSTQIRKLGIAVSLEKEATPEDIHDAEPQVVLVATGGIAVFPDIPGVKRGNVVPAVDALLGKGECGKSVIVIGGGLVGCETALHLALMGRSVTVVEAFNRVMQDMFAINRLHLKKLLAGNGVRILVNAEVSEIIDNGAITIDRGGKRSSLGADTVVLATGFASDDRLYQAIKDKGPETYAIGDCVSPRRVISAIWEGFRIARLI